MCRHLGQSGQLAFVDVPDIVEGEVKLGYVEIAGKQITEEQLVKEESWWIM